MVLGWDTESLNWESGTDRKQQRQEGEMFFKEHSVGCGDWLLGRGCKGMCVKGNANNAQSLQEQKQKTSNVIFKMAKDLNRHFSKENVQIANS